MVSQIGSIQSHDLNPDRRKAIFESGQDSASVADIARIEQNRRINQAGTAEARVSREQKCALNAWNNAHETLKDDIDKGDADIDIIGTGIGQSHRLRLSEIAATTKPIDRRYQGAKRQQRRPPSPPVQNLKVGSIEINHEALQLAKQLRAEQTKAKPSRNRVSAFKATGNRNGTVNTRVRTLRPPIPPGLTILSPNIPPNATTPTVRSQRMDKTNESKPNLAQRRPTVNYQSQLVNPDDFLAAYQAKFKASSKLSTNGASAATDSSTASSSVAKGSNAKEGNLVSSQKAPTTTPYASQLLRPQTNLATTSSDHSSLQAALVLSSDDPIQPDLSLQGLEDLLMEHVLQENPECWKCQVPDCPKRFKGLTYWQKHVNKSHDAWLDDLKSSLHKASEIEANARKLLKQAQSIGLESTLGPILEKDEDVPLQDAHDEATSQTTKEPYAADQAKKSLLPSTPQQAYSKLSLAERVQRQQSHIFGEHVSRFRFHPREVVEALVKNVVAVDPKGLPSTVAAPSSNGVLVISETPFKKPIRMDLRLRTTALNAGVRAQKSGLANAPTLPEFLQKRGMSIDPGAAAREQYGGRDKASVVSRQLVTTSNTPVGESNDSKPSPAMLSHLPQPRPGEKNRGAPSLPEFLRTKPARDPEATARRDCGDDHGASTKTSTTNRDLTNANNPAQPMMPYSQSKNAQNTRRQLGPRSPRIPDSLRKKPQVDPGEAARKQYGGGNVH